MSFPSAWDSYFSKRVNIFRFSAGLPIGSPAFFCPLIYLNIKLMFDEED